MKAFLRYYVELPYPVGQVDDAVARLLPQWLDQAATEAYLRGLLLRRRAPGSEPDLGPISLLVLMTAGPSEAHVLRRSVEWFEAEGDRCLPILRGDLELAELGPVRSQMAVSAQYQPFSRPADGADRMLTQRVGESTLKAFVDRIAGYVQVILTGVPAVVPPLVPQPTLGPGNGWAKAAR